jgi:integrase/recombinase XerC
MLPTSGHSTRYITFLRSLNYADSTVYSRGRAIIRFRLTTGIDPLDIDEHRMIGWWIGLRTTPSSRAGELAAIRGYCRWAVRHGVIEVDPTRLIDRPRLARRVPRPIDEVSLAHAIRTARRDVRAILCLAAFCGLRACEVSALEWSEVRGDTLLLHGKGNKERLVPLHQIAADALTRLPGGRRGMVFQRRDGNLGPVPPHLVCQWSNTHLHELGIAETLHQLRHRYGTFVFRLSKDLRLTQELMGHASPVTTAGYAAWDQSQAAVIISQLPTVA